MRRGPGAGTPRAGDMPQGAGTARCNLHSARVRSPGQAASGRGESNQGLERTPGRGRGRALRGLVEARRRSTLSVRHTVEKIT